ncbi:MAG: prolyl oligopeptidase family serine peptidase [Planctomycetota bacterium]
MKLIAAALAVTLAASSIHAQFTIQDENVAIPLELAFSSRALSKRDQPAVSPDGRFVVYAVEEPVLRRGEKAAGASPRGVRLFLTDVTNGATRALSKEATNSRRPSFSPDGSKIAYYCDEDGLLTLWIYDITKSAARKVIDKPVLIHERLADEPVWIEGGKEVLIGYSPIPVSAGPAAQNQKSERLPEVYKSDEPPPAEYAKKEVLPFWDARQIAFVNIENGNVRNLSGTGTVPPSRARLSPSGKFVSFDSGYRSLDLAEPPFSRDLVVCDASNGNVLFTESNYAFDESGEYDESHRWHPLGDGGDRLFYFSKKRLCVRDFKNGAVTEEKTYGEGLGEADRRFLYFTRDGSHVIFSLVPNGPLEDRRLGVQAVICVELATGIVTALGFPEHTRIVNIFCARPGIAFQPEKGKLAAVARDLQSGLSSFVEIDMESGGITKRKTGTFRAASGGSDSKHHNLLIQFENAQSGAEIYQISRDLNTIKKITAAEKRYDGLALANVEVFSTRVIAPDGAPRIVYSSILLPAGRSKDMKLPVIVSVRGGERHSIEAELFGGGNVASIPSAIFTSRGFAVLFVDSLMESPGKPESPIQNLKEMILPQIARAGELGFIDMDRVGVAGDAYGGYSAASLVTTTPFFKGAAAVSGMYDLTSYETSIRNIEHSPLFRADKITTPLLMIHGGADRERPAADAHKMFRALSRLEKNAELAIYPGEDHRLPDWSFDHASDAAQRLLTFFGKYLKGE